MVLPLSKQASFVGEPNIDFRFQEAIRFFKERSPVIFVSEHYKFWEHHGFVQQSLAKVLTDYGVPVIWFDGADWRKKRPVQTWDSPLLKILQLPCLPLRRIPLIDEMNPQFQVRALKNMLREGKKPFLWVQSGLDERVVSSLPYVDAYSVFDDPYVHSPQGELVDKASLIIVQNEFARELFHRNKIRKLMVLFPPMDMNITSFSDGTEFVLPSDFPKLTMGYIGSFFSRGFDLVMFEDFIRSLPHWGFILCGRTDSVGLKKIQTWKKYKNFFYVSWVPRTQVGALWKKLNLNLMLYRPEPTSHGAFPVKFLEALYHNVPSLTTNVPKTSSLEGVISRLNFPEELKKQAVTTALNSNHEMSLLYQKYSMEMDPKIHLIRVSEYLRNCSS